MIHYLFLSKQLPNDGNSICRDGTSLAPSLPLANWLAGCCLSTYLSYYLCACACMCVPVLWWWLWWWWCQIAAAITILWEQLNSAASSSLVPSLNAASTRSEGIVFHSHLDNSEFVLICSYVSVSFSIVIMTSKLKYSFEQVHSGV